MESEIFSLMDQKAAEAETNDPAEVAEHHKIVVIPLHGSILAYATAYTSKLEVIGMNDKLQGTMRLFAYWHELTHVFAGHIYDPSLGGWLTDNTLFENEYDSRLIARHERTANLVSANMVIPDDEVFDITGLNNPDIRAYRRLRTYYQGLTHEMENLNSALRFGSPSVRLKCQMSELKHKIHDTENTLMDMESELVFSNCCLTFSEIAGELGISECILRYKLEAMRLRGMDIDPQELERYNRMFRNVI